MTFKNSELKPIIDEILKDYFNRNTRINYSRTIQANMVAQNRGLTNACISIFQFAEDDIELASYTKAKLEEINKGEAQEVNIS